MPIKTIQSNIHDGWEAIKLASIFDFKNGLNKEKKYFGQGTPIINYMDVNRGGGLYKDNIFGRVEVNKSELSRFNVKKGDVFFTRTSETLDEIGFSAVALDDFQDTVFSGFVLRARPKGEKLVPGYAQYCFKAQSARKEIMEKSSYTTRALTSGTSLNHVNINLPPLPEQKRIVVVLETWDQAIEKLKRKIEIKKEIKKGLMHDLLTGKTRLSGFSGSWTKIKVGSISNVVSGGTPSTLNCDYWENGHIPWMKSGEINKIYVESTDNFITNLGLAESSAQLLPCNSVLIALAGQGSTRGKVAINRCELSTNQSVAAFIPKNDLDYRFLFFDLSRRYDELRSLSAGDGGRGGLNLMLLKNLQIQLPELSEQKAIAQVLSIGDEEIQLLNKKLNVLKDQKKYLLNNLVTGAIRTSESLSISK